MLLQKLAMSLPLSIAIWQFGKSLERGMKNLADVQERKVTTVRLGNLR